MGSLADHAARLRQVLAIEDVIGQYIALRRFGKNYKGLCPFHSEKTPSFTVTPDRGVFHCFGCQTGGDVITFIRKVENLEFVEALKLLSERAGLPMPEHEGGGPWRSGDGRHQAVLAAAAWAAAEYRHFLMESLKRGDPPIGAYLNKRGLNWGLCTKFGLGLAPESWDWLLRRAVEKGQDPDLLVAAGILGRGAESPNRLYDRFRGRLIIPITDLQGRVVALAGRTYLPDAKVSEPKYINSPESEIYRKGDILYALAEARAELQQSGRALLMEGYLDVMRAHQHGFTGAIATCGTALTDRQARLIKRFAKEVILAFDGDDAGQNAMVKCSALLLAEGLDIRVLSLPAEDDPDTFLRREGPDAFRSLVDSAPHWLDYFLRSGLRMFGNSIEARTRVADRVLPLVARIPNPILRDACGQKVAAVLGVSTGAVEESVRQHGLSLGSGLRDVRSLGASPVPAESLAKPALVRPISRAEIGMIRLLVESVRARAVLLPAMERERLHVGLTVEPIVSILLNRPVSPLPNYHDLIEELSGTGLESAVSAIAVDSEPLDDGDRTLQVVLARLRREKSLRKLRQVTSGGFAGMDGADMAEIPAEGGAELSPGEWETLESAPQASLTQQDDLFSRMTVAHQAATEAVENARALYSHGEDTPRIRP